ncbi:MAG: SDR family NAD(P)-dependent oxidoreductase [Solirubrobacteraceae bacterium]
MAGLQGANVVVTGGATGVGQALAVEAGRRGARVVIADVNDASSTVEKVIAVGGTASWVETDVTQYQSLVDLAAHVRDAFGGANVLINNAAGSIEPGAGLETADPELAAQLFRITILGVFHGIRAFAEDLRAAAGKSEAAYVLNVGSEHSLGVPPHVMPLSPYTVSKYATLGFTDTARRDFAGTGIGVSMLAPGWVLTELVQSIIASDDNLRQAIEPYAQDDDIVARAAFDGLLDGHYIIATNPASREFAMQHARDVMAEVQRLPLTTSDTAPAHGGTGDPENCPVDLTALGVNTSAN